MEILERQRLALPIHDPLLFLHRLTGRTIPVATGVVERKRVIAAVAFLKTRSHFRRPAFHDVTDHPSFVLDDPILLPVLRPVPSHDIVNADRTGRALHTRPMGFARLLFLPACARI